jgi:low affinity Fe/Cu permease
MANKKETPAKPAHMERLASAATKATGSNAAIIIACSLVVLWAVLGPVFNYSANWQLVINTGTTIITFLMVFLIQKSQNKESLAVQLKLNELIAAHEYASNRLVDVENMSEEELKTIHDYYCDLKEMAKKDESLQASHSIDEAENRHTFKLNAKAKQNESVADKTKK